MNFARRISARHLDAIRQTLIFHERLQRGIKKFSLWNECVASRHYCSMHCLPTDNRELLKGCRRRTDRSVEGSNDRRAFLLMQVQHTGVSKYMLVLTDLQSTYPANLTPLTVRLFVQLDATDIYVETAHLPKRPAIRFTILPDGPSISELSQTRPCWNCHYCSPRDGMSQTNNGEHNENQYSHEWAFNAAIERWITSFTVNQAWKFVNDKDTFGKREVLNYYRDTVTIFHFNAESWCKTYRIYK